MENNGASQADEEEGRSSQGSVGTPTSARMTATRKSRRITSQSSMTSIASGGSGRASLAALQKREAQKARRSLAYQKQALEKEASMLRCRVFESNLDRLASWGDTASVEQAPPSDLEALPLHLQTSLQWVFKQLKSQREGIGIIARSVKPWEDIVKGGGADNKQVDADKQAAPEVESAKQTSQETPLQADAEKKLTPQVLSQADPEQESNSTAISAHPACASTEPSHRVAEADETCEEAFATQNFKSDTSPFSSQSIQPVLQLSRLDAEPAAVSVAIDGIGSPPSGKEQAQLVSTVSSPSAIGHASMQDNAKVFGSVTLNWMVRTEGNLREKTEHIEKLEESMQILRSRFDKFTVEMSRYFKRPPKGAVPADSRPMDLFHSNSMADQSQPPSRQRSRMGSLTPGGRNSGTYARAESIVDDAQSVASSSPAGSGRNTPVSPPDGRASFALPGLRSLRKHITRDSLGLGTSSQGLRASENDDAKAQVPPHEPLMAVTRGEFAELQQIVTRTEESVDSLYTEVNRLLTQQQRRVDDLEATAAEHFTQLREMATMASEAAAEGLEATKRATALAQSHLDDAARRNDLLHQDDMSSGSSSDSRSDEELKQPQSPVLSPKLSPRFGDSDAPWGGSSRPGDPRAGAPSPTSHASHGVSFGVSPYRSRRLGKSNSGLSECSSEKSYSSSASRAPSHLSHSRHSHRGHKSHRRYSNESMKSCKSEMSNHGANENSRQSVRQRAMQNMQVLQALQNLSAMQDRVKSLELKVNGMAPDVAAIRKTLTNMRASAQYDVLSGRDHLTASPQHDRHAARTNAYDLASGRESPKDISKGMCMRAKMEVQKRLPMSAPAKRQVVPGAFDTLEPRVQHVAVGMVVRTVTPVASQSPEPESSITEARFVGTSSSLSDKRKHRPVNGFRGLKPLSNRDGFQGDGGSDFGRILDSRLA